MKSEIQETIDNAIEEAMNAIRYNICNELGGLLFGLQLDLEKIGGVGDLGALIGAIMRTSKYDGPEGEEYPVWDRKSCSDILKRFVKVLQAKGITQSYGYTIDEKRV